MPDGAFKGRLLWSIYDYKKGALLLWSTFSWVFNAILQVEQQLLSATYSSFRHCEQKAHLFTYTLKLQELILLLMHHSKHLWARLLLTWCRKRDRNMLLLAMENRFMDTVVEGRKERVGWGGRWEDGSRGRGHMYTYDWLMLMFGRNQHNS